MPRTEKMKEPGEGVEVNLNIEIYVYMDTDRNDTKQEEDHFHSKLEPTHSNQPAVAQRPQTGPAGGSNTTNWTCSGALCRGRARAPAVVEGEPRSDKAEEQVGEGSSRSTLAWGEADREPVCKVLRGGARMRGMIKGGSC